MPEDLIEAINEMDTFTTNIQINHFDSDHYTAKKIISTIPKMTVKLNMMMWITLNKRVTMN